MRHSTADTVPGRRSASEEGCLIPAGVAEPTGRPLHEARVLIAGLEPYGAVAATTLAAIGVGTLLLLDDGRVAPQDMAATDVWHTGQLQRSRRRALRENLAAAAPGCQVETAPLSVIENREHDPSLARCDLVLGTLHPDDLRHHRAIARFAHRAGIVSLFAAIYDDEMIAGPLVVPGETACWECCRLRQLANTDDPRAAHARQQALLERRGRLPPLALLSPWPGMLGELLAREVRAALTGGPPSPVRGRLLVRRIGSPDTMVHAIVAMPWCDVCGGAAGFPSPRSAPNQLKGDATPEDVRRSLAGWLDPCTGVIASLLVGSSDGSTPPPPVCAAALLSAYTEGHYLPTILEIGFGKGVSETEAMIGAVGEAIERYSAARVRLGDLRRAPMRALPGDVLDPRALCLYSEVQYRLPNFPYVRFDPDRPIHWAEGRWLDSGAPVWVPAQMAYLPFPPDAEASLCQATSNGLAAGADLGDAAVRAVLELVERDAFMLTWLCRLPGRRLLVDGGLDRSVQDILQRLIHLGALPELYLLDVGIAIPTVVCLALGDGERWPGAVLGLGAHPSPREAARKAILEVGQTGPFLRRVMAHGEEPIPVRPEAVRTFRDHALFYLPPERARAFDALRARRDEPVPLTGLEGEAESSLRACLASLAAAGVRVAIADVTAPDVAHSPFRVVRALGTNLQPIHSGLGGERLNNPRLRALLRGGINSDLHPLS